jgi:hypothetical protein
LRTSAKISRIAALTPIRSPIALVRSTASRSRRFSSSSARYSSARAIAIRATSFSNGLVM